MDEKSRGSCHVHNHAHSRANSTDLSDIRRTVCELEDDLVPYDGRRYCLFHLPDSNKDQKAFSSRLEARISYLKKATTGEISSNERLLGSMEGETEDTERLIQYLKEDSLENQPVNVTYDFRYFWFPSEISFKDFDFNADADFDYATFAEDAYFDSVRFRGEANFKAVTFCSKAIFQLSIFEAISNFEEVNFSSEVNFQRTTFMDEVSFRLATFSSTGEFGSAQFLEKANFKSVLVAEPSQLFFNPSRFCGNADFGLVTIKGYLHFEGGSGRFFKGEWLDDRETQPNFSALDTEVFEGDLNFTSLRSDKPEHISFRRVRLRPHWFVDCDSRKFSFMRVNWVNHTCVKKEIDLEVKALIDRNFREQEILRMMTIAFTNLAANAEEFNRFDEASNFRKSAFECERLEKVYKKKKWQSQSFRRFARGVRCREAPLALVLAPARYWKFLQRRESVIVHSLYRKFSFYGESWSRALVWLTTTWIGFGFGYWLIRCFEKQSVTLTDLVKSLGYSFLIMTFQKPDFYPKFFLTYIFYGLQILFTPVLLALLALAIRRKFMR